MSDIPVLFASGENLPEAWEKAVLAVWDHGVEVRTEYDKPKDPPSLDATVMVEVRRPLSEPRVHPCRT
jgi:thymidylate synthase